MSFKFGLNVKNKGTLGLGKPGAKPAAAKKKSLFDDEAEDTTITKKDGAQEIGGLAFDDTIAATEDSSEAKKPKVKKGQPPSAPPNRKVKARDDDPSLEHSASAKESERRAQEALKTDATIYDYDSAYDALHARAAAKKAEEQQDPSAPRQSQHMQSLFDSAEQRKKDQLRAKDKLLQREREAEGDEFADKEKFVTGAYKAQQEEARQAEEEEKKRQAAEDERKKKDGMAGFHKRMLLEQEKRHQEAMEAAAEAAKEGYKPPVDIPQEKTDAQIASELRQQGKKVDLNEEGQIADKRQTLNAGLNIVAKPRPVVVAQTTTTARPANSQLSSHQGNKSGRNAQRDRQTQMVAQQIEAAAKRKADEEAEEQAKVQHAAKSQKTAGDISSAKERYLQRKREAAEAKAAAEGK